MAVSSRSKALIIVGIITTIGLAGTAAGAFMRADPNAAPPPPPPFSGPVEAIDRRELLAYASSLDFMEHTGDEQHLPAYQAGGKSIPGPFGQLAAPRGSNRQTSAALAEGRVLARIIVDAAYPPLGLTPGVNYVWADSVSSGWRMTYVPADPEAPLVSHPMVLNTSHRDRPDLPYARWREVGASVGPWSGCTRSVCCERGGDPPERPSGPPGHGGA